jgi:hypothetical protein
MVVDGAMTSGMGGGSLAQGQVVPPIIEEEWSGPSFQMKRPS